MGDTTDQEHPRKVGDRLAPATTPDKDAIREDRKAVDQGHDADREPSPEEEAAAERGASATDPDSATHYKEMLERGAAQEGEGRPQP
ncbi:MAG: hypothetical protein ACJ739_10165 [Acidimicrobiales bacterium]